MDRASWENPRRARVSIDARWRFTFKDGMVAEGVTESPWPSRPLRALLLVLALAVVLGALPLLAIAPHTSAQEESAPAVGSDVIVVLEEGEDPVAAAREMGIEVKHIYQHVFNGFAGTVLPPSTGDEITVARARRGARDISPDGKVSIEAQTIPTGVSRVGTPLDPDGEHLDIDSPIDADIAIIDTGISNIPDLDVAGGINCIGSNPNAWQDDNGHGSHVAGIAAAADNDLGVVGVAPGARLWAVKVLNEKGEGSFSNVICGLDWVAANSDVIDVANLSLSGADKKGNCDKPALHRAICDVVEAGVTVVVAAGNQGVNAKTRVPAGYDQVITVSGITDSDGKPGKLGPKPCFAKSDDRFLNFTNYGGDIDIAAPGGCILSYNDLGQLVEVSGTSQAAPHVVGAAADFVALFEAENGSRPSPTQVKTWLLTEASRSQAEDGVTGDPDSKKQKKKDQKDKKRKGKKHKKGKGGKHKKHKKRKGKNKKIKDGPAEPVLWLEVLGAP